MQQHLIFVRHGATQPNLAGLRCGGDLDVPLVELGRRQAIAAAERIRALGTPVGVIVTSPLQRTLETATIISRVLGGVPLVVEPAFSERRLGDWNMRPLEETEHLLAGRVTPPGGESEGAFTARIAGAVTGLALRACDRPLLVGSKGVARVLGLLLGARESHAVGNGGWLHFDLAAYAPHEAIGCPA